MTIDFTNFDTGFSGSLGPWVLWSALIRGFLLRQGSDKVPFTGFDTGVVLDVDTMKTGWQRSEGVAGVPPEWEWNANVSRFAPRPGEDWKQGFHIACAFGEEQSETAVWEQAGASAWNGFLGVLPALTRRPPGDVLPLVKLVGTKDLRFQKGRSTMPVLEVVSWGPRLASLTGHGLTNSAAGGASPQGGGAAGPIATGATALAGHAASADTDLDDIIPF